MAQYINARGEVCDTLGSRGWAASKADGIEPVRENMLRDTPLCMYPNEFRKEVRSSAYGVVKHAFHYGFDSVKRKYDHPAWKGATQFRYDDDAQEILLNVNGLVMRVSFTLTERKW